MFIKDALEVNQFQKNENKTAKKIISASVMVAAGIGLAVILGLSTGIILPHIIHNISSCTIGFMLSGMVTSITCSGYYILDILDNKKSKKIPQKKLEKKVIEQNKTFRKKDNKSKKIEVNKVNSKFSIFASL
jgi:hypothetical protein